MVSSLFNLASLAPVKESSIVNISGLISNREELKLFALLGCGYQTGARTVINGAETTHTETLAILRFGGVGMVAIMASTR
jgi:Zn-dependent alcohol dehydrogenase